MPSLPAFSLSMDYFNTIYTQKIYLEVELQNLMNVFDFQSYFNRQYHGDPCRIVWFQWDSIQSEK